MLFPEDTNNFKDMIHGIHASAARTKAYEFVRDRGTSGVYGYDWSEVTFPGILNNCETCHKEGTYEIDALPESGLIPGNVRTASGNSAPDTLGGLVNIAPLERLVEERIAWPDLRRNLDAGKPGALCVAPGIFTYRNP